MTRHDLVHELQMRIRSNCRLCGPSKGVLLYNALTQRLPLQAIAARFGWCFIIFSNASDAIFDMNRVLGITKSVSLAHTLSLGMSWKERRILMEATDNLWEEPERKGAQTAYLAYFGSTSWEEEKLVVQAELAYAHHVHMQSAYNLSQHY